MRTTPLTVSSGGMPKSVNTWDEPPRWWATFEGHWRSRSGSFRCCWNLDFVISVGKSSCKLAISIVLCYALVLPSATWVTIELRWIQRSWLIILRWHHLRLANNMQMADLPVPYHQNGNADLRTQQGKITQEILRGSPQASAIYSNDGC